MSKAAATRGEFTRLMARDGHEFDAWLSPPAGAPRGAVLVLQEIFGVNSHIRAVADGFAAEGYLAIAPSLFDRVKRNVEMGYTPPEIEQGRGYMLQIPEEKLLLDMRACVNVVRHAGRVGAVGYCWGGSLAYLAACELPVAAAVSYYGTRTLQYLEKKPRAPVMSSWVSRDVATTRMASAGTPASTAASRMSSASDRPASFNCARTAADSTSRRRASANRAGSVGTRNRGKSSPRSASSVLLKNARNR